MSDPALMARFALDHAHLQTMLFLQLAAGGHLLLFVVRTRGSVHRAALPGGALVPGAIVATQVVAVLMCGYGILVPQLPWAAIGGVWLYELVWMIVLDVVKLLYVRHRGRAAHARGVRPARSRSRGARGP